MKRAFLLLGLAACSPVRLEGVVPPFAPEDERVFLELEGPSRTVFVHETVRLVLRFGFEQGFLDAEVVQLFRQDLELPAQVLATWSDGFAGARVVPAPAAAGATARFALNDGFAAGAVATLERLDGVRFTTLELTFELLPERAGLLELPPTFLRYAWATEFEDDVFQGRVPLDRHDGVFEAAPLTLNVRELPREDQPTTFTGAVGSFTFTAELAPREPGAGSGVLLALRVAGVGNLELFGPPLLDPLAREFRVLATHEELEAGARTFHIELQARAEQAGTVRTLPALEFAWFDPAPPAGYHTTTVGPWPLTLRSGALDDGAVDPPEDLPLTTDGLRDEANASNDGRNTLLIALVAASLLGLLLAVLRRRSHRSGSPTHGAARTSAFTQAARALRAASDDELPQAFVACLAAALGLAPERVEPRRLEHELCAAGVPAPLAREAAATLAALLAARYGASAAAPASADVRALADALLTELGA